MSTSDSGTRDLPAIAAPGLVGRERELAALRAALSDPPAVVLIEGEAGIGKTRLADELAGSGCCRRLVRLFDSPSRSGRWWTRSDRRPRTSAGSA